MKKLNARDVINQVVVTSDLMEKVGIWKSEDREKRRMWESVVIPENGLVRFEAIWSVEAVISTWEHMI